MSDEFGQMFDWIRRQRRPVLASELADEFGYGSANDAIVELQRRGRIRATFPEAKPGDSGRQFWEVE
ncbi:hypothetical protein FHS96_004952 [Sphingomonas zeicaulis]|uniref:hypothetical protein n=1 Tax=Sphingomonas zeicaulis TaxID=1632740 RepID=UPI003D1BA3A4